MRVGLKIARKCCLYLDIFSYVRINVFRPSFAFRFKMHVRCDNRYKTGTDGGTILRKPMLFERLGFCVLSPAHECEIWDFLVYLLTVKYLSILFKFSHSMLD